MLTLLAAGLFVAAAFFVPWPFVAARMRSLTGFDHTRPGASFRSGRSESELMDLLICIDDTDDIDSRGTGEIAELMAGGLEEAGWPRAAG